MRITAHPERLVIRAALTALLLVSIASNTQAQDAYRIAIEDCDSEAPARKLLGCSVLIQKSLLSPTQLAVAHSRRSDAHLEMRKFDLAVADRAKAFHLQPNDPDYKRRLSQAHTLRASAGPIDQGTHDRALADYSQAILLHPANHEAYFLRSELFAQVKESDAAIADLQAALQLDPANGVYQARLAHLHERRALDRLLKKNFDGAINDYTDALQVQPSTASHYLNRATARVAKGEIDLALNDYSEAIRVDPKEPEAFVRRGELLRTRGDIAKAIAAFGEAINADGKNTAALMMRALAREDNGEPDLAIQDYQAVLRMDASHKLARASLARLGTRPIAPDTASPKTKSGSEIRSTPDKAAPAAQPKATHKTAHPGAEKREPPAGSVQWGQTMLIDDGTCPAGQIKEITGGNSKYGLPRKRRCMTR